jgi:hypothetical protein
MKRSLIIGFVLLLSVVVLSERSGRLFGPAPQKTGYSGGALVEAYNSRASDIQVQGRGRVEKNLPDDTRGRRHQRFILRLDSGQTILVAHNIDLAPRVENLQKEDQVSFYGEYEWNDKGGVVHWTHRDPGGSHIDGWLEHGGRVYQ